VWLPDEKPFFHFLELLAKTVDGSWSDRRRMSLVNRVVPNTADMMRFLRASVIEVSAARERTKDRIYFCNPTKTSDQLDSRLHAGGVHIS
jgi:hypothetical protein